MIESPKSPERGPSMEEVAKRANYQGNHSLLLIERLSDPRIHDQVVDLWFAYERLEHKEKAKSREDVAKEFDRRLENAQTSTPVNFEGTHGGPLDPDDPLRETVPIGMTVGGKTRNVAYMSAVEAHEKGHYLRPFSGQSFREHFKNAIDTESIELSDSRWDEMQADPKFQEAQRIEPDLSFSRDAVTERVRSNLSEPYEIVERMSQLKNYFGMKGNETFSPNHLSYAREHYIHDTGIDNGMFEFFAAITPETEKEFLRLINNSGI
ncbi:hypothetical protein HY968_03445 [Candidatus Kaiserbacteria bacterium]|nr:hypothetical protein [Candidatus Kaiserbacteria bacterium]